MDEFTGKISQGTLPGKPRKSLRILDFLRRRMLFVLGSGALLFILFFPVLLMMSKPYYKTSGRVMIIRKMQQILSEDTSRSVSSYFTDYARTQVERIKHRSILLAAFERLSPEMKDALMPPGLPANTIVQILRNRLELEFIYGTHLIEIRLQGPAPVGMAEFANEMMEVFVERVQQEQKVQDHLYVNFLGIEKDRLQKEIEGIESRLMNLTQQTQTATFSEAYNPFSRLYSLLQEAKVQARHNRLKLENQYRELEKQAQEIRSLPLDALADEIVASDQSLWDMEAWTYRTLQDMRQRLDGIAPDNPDRRYVEERMKAMQDYLKKSRKEVVERTERIVHDKREYNLNSRLIEAKHTYQAALNTENEIEEMMKMTAALANEASRKILEGDQLQKIMQYRQEKLNRIESRLAELKVETQTPSQVLIETRATKPSAPEARNVKKLFLMAFVLSFGLVGGLAFVYDFIDTRIRGHNEVADALGSSSLRAVPLYFADEQARAFARVSLDDQSSQAAVALRSIASRIDQERMENDARVIMLTGTERQVGVSEITLNTAHAMKHFCERILVIEANPKFPKLNGLLEKTQVKDKTVLDVFRFRNIKPEDHLFHDAERDIDVFVFPNPETNDTPLQTSEFREALQKLRYRYDVIFFDTAPLLQSDLSEFVARFSDIVMLVSEGDWSLYKDLRDSLQLCARLNVPAVAGILNWGGHATRQLNLRWVPPAPWPYTKRRKQDYIPKFIWEKALANNEIKAEA